METRKPYYFPDKESAEAFRSLAKRARVSGRVAMRKTLAERSFGAQRIRDTKHLDGYTVFVRAFAFADEIELAEMAKSAGRIPGPGGTQ